MGQKDGYFDFEEKIEEPETLDFAHLTPCPHCGKPIPRDAMLCLYCGESTNQDKRNNWIIWTAVIAVISFLIFIAVK